MSDDHDGRGPRGVGSPKEVAGSLDQAAAEMERGDGVGTALGSSDRTCARGISMWRERRKEKPRG